MKNILKKILILTIRPFARLLQAINAHFSKVPLKSMSWTMSIICQAVETEKEYPAYQIMPKNTAEIPVFARGGGKPYRLAIVLQGPLCVKDNMTKNTIIFYKKVYPYADIIVSTWDDEPKDELDKLAALGAVIVASKKPEKCGVKNVNLQIRNSLAGVEKAKEVGCKFSVKTRTDQRICKPFVFDAMVAATILVPGTENQCGRLTVFGNWNGGMFSPYCFNDFLYLGYTEDLIRLFSVPFDDRDVKELETEMSRTRTRRDLSSKMTAAECYIMKHYCTDVLHFSGEDTVKEHWKIVKNNLICYSMKDVNLMWNKYDRLYDENYYSYMYEEYDSLSRLSTMYFNSFNWFNLYIGNFVYEEAYEKYADVPIAVKET